MRYPQASGSSRLTRVLGWSALAALALNTWWGLWLSPPDVVQGQFVRMLYIHPDECVDCGACEPVCPVEAIFYEDDVPDQWKDYYKANVEFFEDLGSPGGAAKTGKIPKDHPLIAALPPQEQEAAH